MEGVSYEALSFAGTQCLDKLIVLYDANNISLDGPISMSFTEDVVSRMEDLGFYVQMIESDVDLIERAIKKAKKAKKPSFIYISSVIGDGSRYEGTNIVHGKPLDQEDILNLKSRYQLNTEPFVLSAEILEFWHKQIAERCAKDYEEWMNDKLTLCNSNKNIKLIFKNIDKTELNTDFDLSNFEVSEDYEEELRVTNQKVMNILARKSPFFIGGSADLSSSTKALILNDDFMSKEKPLARNIPFGVREHAMGAILNGLALSHLHVFGSTFLTFSDYLKPAIRMSALMNLPVNYVFTHDSVLIGEDGPTHQPIEQLISLRSIPNLNVFRPADINEVLGVWDYAIKSKNPNAIVISKNKLPKLVGTQAELVDELDLLGIHTRVVSMVSQELFDKQSDEYKEQLIPKNALVIAYELSTTNNYTKYTKEKFIIGVNEFGHSGNKDDVAEKLLVSYDAVKSRIEKIIRTN